MNETELAAELLTEIDRRIDRKFSQMKPPIVEYQQTVVPSEVKFMDREHTIIEKKAAEVRVEAPLPQIIPPAAVNVDLAGIRSDVQALTSIVKILVDTLTAHGMKPVDRTVTVEGRDERGLAKTFRIVG